MTVGRYYILKLYAFFITCPLALLIQHLYSEIYATFYKFRKKFIIMCILTSALFSMSMFFWKILSDQVCLEFFLTVVITILISIIISKFEIRKKIDCFEKAEKVVIYPQMLIGFFWCIVPFVDVFRENAYKICHKNEIVLFHILYILLGISYIFFNRLFFCGLYNILGKIRKVNTCKGV